MSEGGAMNTPVITLCAILATAGAGWWTYTAGVDAGRQKADDACLNEKFALSTTYNQQLKNQKEEAAKQLQQWKTVQQNEKQEAQRENDEINRQLVTAQLNNDWLRAKLTHLQQQSANRPATGQDDTGAGSPGLSTPATSQGDLYSVMLVGMDSVATELAYAADDARRRGQQCERFYDALTQTAQSEDPHQKK